MSHVTFSVVYNALNIYSSTHDQVTDYIETEVSMFVSYVIFYGFALFLYRMQGILFELRDSD